jgi:hypothetical protein
VRSRIRAFPVFLIISALIIILTLSPAKAVTEAPPTQWQQFLKGNRGWSVLQTADGGYAVTGDNGSSSLLIRTDSSGLLLWAKTYQIGEKATSLPYLVSSTDEGYALAGTWENQVALVKVDSEGNTQWNKTFAYNAASVHLRSLIQTNDKGYALVVLGQAEAGPHGIGQIWFVKVNAQGEMQWNKTIIGKLGEYPNSVLQTSDGGYAIIGTSWSSGFPSYYKLIKTDSNGNEQWNKTYGGEGTFYTAENNYGIITSDGGFMLSGFIVGADKGWTAWLVKTDSQGNTMWNGTYGTGGGCVADSVIQTSDGGYAFTGVVNKTVGWVVKTGAIGTMDWELTFSGGSFVGSSVEDFGKPIVQSADGGYSLVGTINGQIWLFKLATQSSALPLLEIAAIAIVAVVIIVAILVFVFRKSIFKKQ